MSNAIRKTIDFSDSMYEQIKAHSNEQGCRSFSEAVRDIIRIAKNHGLLTSLKASPDPKFLQHRICKDTGGGVGSSSGKRNE
jgi:predicted CopG family antitoxin